MTAKIDLGNRHDVRVAVEAISRGDIDLLKQLPEEHRALFMRAANEMSRTGNCSLLDKLWEIDRTEQPVDIDTFIDSPDYMGFPKFWSFWRTELRYVLDPDNRIVEWAIEGGKRAGKTTASIVAILYKIYLLTTYRDPQSMYGLLPNSRIAFGLFNLTKTLTQSVAYNQIQAYMQSSSYFQKVCRKRPGATERLDFPKNIALALGSQAVHALGQAMCGGLLDEANLHAVEGGHDIRKTYGELRTRLIAEFTDRMGPPGLLIVPSQPDDEDGWLTKHIEEHKNDRRTHVTRVATWDTREDGAEKERRFWVIVGNRNEPTTVHTDEPKELPPGRTILRPPIRYLTEFERDPEGSVRDYGGLPTFGVDSLIAQRDLVDACVDETLVHPFPKEEVMVGLGDGGNPLRDLFNLDVIFEHVSEAQDIWRMIRFPDSPRFIHVDLAKNHDAAGLACVCLSGLENQERLDKDQQPYTVPVYAVHVDFAVRIVNKKDSEIDFDGIVDFILWLYGRGLPLFRVTYDGWQSVGSLQTFKKTGIDCGVRSVDQTIEPYSMYRDLILQRRIVLPPHPRVIEETKRLRLVREKKRYKVDHPPNYTKDICDAVCGASFEAVTNRNAIALLDAALLKHQSDPLGDLMDESVHHVVVPRRDYDEAMLGKKKPQAEGWEHDPFKE